MGISSPLADQDIPLTLTKQSREYGQPVLLVSKRWSGQNVTFANPDQTEQGICSTSPIGFQMLVGA